MSNGRTQALFDAARQFGYSGRTEYDEQTENGELPGIFKQKFIPTGGW